MFFSDFSNRPVVDITTGTLLATVETLHVDADLRRVLGACVQRRGVLRRRGYIPMERICLLGRHALLVAHRPMAAQTPAVQPWCHYRLYRADGSFCGEICDLLVDETGRVKGWQIRKSLPEDMKNGREILPCTGKIALNGHRITLT